MREAANDIHDPFIANGGIHGCAFARDAVMPEVKEGATRAGGGRRWLIHAAFARPAEDLVWRRSMPALGRAEIEIETLERWMQNAPDGVGPE